MSHCDADVAGRIHYVGGHNCIVSRADASVVGCICYAGYCIANVDDRIGCVGRCIANMGDRIGNVSQSLVNVKRFINDGVSSTAKVSFSSSKLKGNTTHPAPL